MKVVAKRSTMEKIVRDFRASGKKVGFVPTMGFLHDGHLSLIHRARKENDVVIASIFVNPTQFAPHEDFAEYPRDFKRDHQLLKNSVDYLFLPERSQIYREDEKVTFQLKDITANLCGFSRPDHFAGVALVVAKLFQIIRPHRAYFGQKDFQQTVVVKHLIDDLFFDTKLVVCPTVREVDGLALSSRNIYLTAHQRKLAPYLYQALRLGLKLFRAGEKKPEVIIRKMQNFLKEKGLKEIDYIDIRDAMDLTEIKTTPKQKIVLALAAFLGKTRLIDNIIFDPHEA